MGRASCSRGCGARTGLPFLLAMAVEIVIVALQDAGALKLVVLAAAGAVGLSMLRKPWVRPRRASVDT